MIKNPILPLSPCALLVACFIAGAAQAQSITFSGDSTPVGSMADQYATVDITVGNTGTGALDANANARFGNSGLAVIGANAGSSGTATLSNGVSWGAREITVGQSGTGTVNVKDSSVSSSLAIIGQNAGSIGTVTVDGANASWNIPPLYQSDLSIGSNGGSGTLNVRNGGMVATTASITTAATAGSAATVLVDGANSQLKAIYQCSLGMKDVSSVQISNGGQVECYQGAYLGFGSVSLQGVGSKWVVGADLDIGYTENASQAVLNIGEGSLVEVAAHLRLPNASSASADSSGTINIEGSTTPGALTVGSFEFGANGLGVINFNHTDASGNYQFAMPLTGTGSVNVSNAGTTVITGNNTYAGTTAVKAGTLRAGSATGLSAASDFVVASGGTLDTNTFSPTVNSLRNDGLVTMLAGGTTGVLTVAGNYAGNGGSVALNTALGGSNSATEKLIVNGDTSGTTTLNITNLGGAGAATTGEGILVVQVNGASNGTFSLPAPGYVQAGSFRYDLVKTGNHWYLVSESRAESAPTVSVVCSPAELSDAAAETATCKLTLSAALTTDLGVNLTLPATSGRYTTTCTSPIVIAANATEASCTITSVPNNTANDGDVIAELGIAPPTTADAYTPGPAAQVLIKDKDKTGGDNGGGDNGGGNGGGDNGGGTAVPHKVPTMGAMGLMAMASVLGLLGVRRTRASGTPQSGTPQSGTRRAPGTSA